MTLRNKGKTLSSHGTWPATWHVNRFRIKGDLMPQEEFSWASGGSHIWRTGLKKEWKMTGASNYLKPPKKMADLIDVIFGVNDCTKRHPSAPNWALAWCIGFLADHWGLVYPLASSHDVGLKENDLGHGQLRLWKGFRKNSDKTHGKTFQHHKTNDLNHLNMFLGGPPEWSEWIFSIPVAKVPGWQQRKINCTACWLHKTGTKHAKQQWTEMCQNLAGYISLNITSI